ncbi:MAG: hypothetical protein JWL87_140 [Candidatus Adlerbacteria bacterium]|nr:hypothetical protein [Candidatus Adlerbacteria bacterium]
MNTLARFFSALGTYVSAHRAISLVAAVLLLAGGWYVFGKATAASIETRYVLGTVERGTIVSSLSASGQVSASNQVDLKPGASGKVTYVGVKAGQEVKAGQLLVRLDAGDAADALETAQLEYEKLVTVDSGDLRDAQTSADEAGENVEASYVSARATLTKASTDMPDVLTGLNDLFARTGYLSIQNYSLTPTEKEYRDRARDAWYEADLLLSALVKSYRSVPLAASESEIDTLLNQSYEAASAVSSAAKYSQDAVVYMRSHDGNSAADEAYASVTELTGTANGIVSALSSAQASITASKRALTKAQDALGDIKDGPDDLDRRSQALEVAQKREALADYSVYAPFSGVIASVDAKVGEAGSSGTAVATLISKSQIAEVSLNEVDAAKVAVGQKATLTFDALEDLTLTGTVVEVDAIGAVSSGVVSYGVQIALDAQDSRIKPGMTVNANIQTETALDVLMVPASAVKTSQGQNYVLVFDPVLDESAATAGSQGVASAVAPVQVQVEVGISDDANVEIVSGLEEGRQIVVRSIAASSAATASATRSASGATGVRTGGVGGTAPAGAVMRAF